MSRKSNPQGKFDRPRSPTDGAAGSELRAGLRRLAEDETPDTSWHLGARLRNYFLTGLVIVGPVTLTIYIIWWFINVVDAWVKPLLPSVYNPDTYLHFPVPGIGLVMGIIALTMIGALTANLLGRTLISFGELMVGRMPIVRNVYRALKQIFESAVSATGPNSSFQKVGLIEFPSKGLWSLVFVTGETTGEIPTVQPGGETDLLTVWVPTGIVPPTGFICFLPRREVIFLTMSVEDAAKIIISGGMVMPDHGARLKALAEAKGGGVPPDAEQTRRLVEEATAALGRDDADVQDGTARSQPTNRAAKRAARFKR